MFSVNKFLRRRRDRSGNQLAYHSTSELRTTWTRNLAELDLFIWSSWSTFRGFAYSTETKLQPNKVSSIIRQERFSPNDFFNFLIVKRRKKKRDERIIFRENYLSAGKIENNLETVNYSWKKYHRCNISCRKEQKSL